MTPTAGGILAASDALRGPRQLYTREQVAYLMSLAYDSGRTAALLDDLAIMHAAFAAHTWRETNERRVARELAEMDRAARAAAERAGRPYRIHPGGPVDWDTGQPVRNLEKAA